MQFRLPSKPGPIRFYAWMVGLALFFTACAGQAPLPEPEMTVAVWPIEDFSLAGKAKPELAEMLWTHIMATIQTQGGVILVERERLDLALEELRLGTSELVDESTRLDIGKLIGARAMVFGGYQIFGETMRLDLRLVEVETGRILNSVAKTTAADGLTPWLQAAQEAALDLFLSP